MGSSMFDDKVEKFMSLSRKIIATKANDINLYQRLQSYNSEQKSQAIEGLMVLLTSYHRPGEVVHLNLTDNDLTIKNLSSLGDYNGNQIEVDLSSNNLVIHSEEDECIWASILENSCLKLAAGWGQPVYSK